MDGSFAYRAHFVVFPRVRSFNESVAFGFSLPRRGHSACWHDVTSWLERL